MVEFTATLEKFGKKGEKTGWTYITVPGKIASKLKANTKKSFRVKGKLDNFTMKGVALIPMGEGDYIIPINAAMRKGIKKQLKGEKVVLKLEEDKAPLELSADFLACLAEDKQAKLFFDTLGRSHQHYYSKWIESAKTDSTKAKRIAQAINGFRMKMGYPEMLRYYREHKI
jgi:hypothetical protein